MKDQDISRRAVIRPTKNIFETSSNLEPLHVALSMSERSCVRNCSLDIFYNEVVSNKAAYYRATTFLKRGSGTCFHVNFSKFFRTSIFFSISFVRSKAFEIVELVLVN